MTNKKTVKNLKISISSLKIKIKNKDYTIITNKGIILLIKHFINIYLDLSFF